MLYFASKYDPWDLTHLLQYPFQFSEQSSNFSCRIAISCLVEFFFILSTVWNFFQGRFFCFGKNKDSQGAKTGQHTWVMRCKTKRNLQMEWRISKRITMQSFTQKAFQCWLSKPTEECSHILCKVFSDWFSSSLKLPK